MYAPVYSAPSITARSSFSRFRNRLQELIPTPITMAILFGLCLLGWISLVAPATLSTLIPSTSIPITTTTTTSTTASPPVQQLLSSSIAAKLAAQPPLPPTQQPNNALLAAIRSGSLEKSDAIFQVASALFQKERKWLQSEKWLIDNVYRLRNELGSLKRELADMRNSHPAAVVAQLHSSPSSSSPSSSSLLPLRTTTRQSTTGDVGGENYRVEFVHDIGSLRADHNVIAQQQQQLMQLLKDTQSQLIRSQLEQRHQMQQQMSLQQHLLSPTVNNLLAYEQLSKPSMTSTTTVTAGHQHMLTEADEDQQRKKLKQKRAVKESSASDEETVAKLSAELHSIRDASVTLFKDLQALQKRVLSESVARTSSIASRLASGQS